MEEPSPVERAVREKIKEAAAFINNAVQDLDRCDRVDASDSLLIAVSKTIEARKSISTWIKLDPAWGMRMREASKAFEKENKT